MKYVLTLTMLLLCGTLDPRLGISREFADSLANAGFTVETGWPRTQ